MGNSDVPTAVAESYYGDEVTESCDRLKPVDDFDVSGEFNVSSFRKENASGVRSALRLVKLEEPIPAHVEVSDLGDGENVFTVIEDVRIQLGNTWDVLVEMAKTCSVKLKLDGIGGQKLRIKPGKFDAGLVLSRDKKDKK